MTDLARFESAFAHNFYLTREWADFWQRVTARPLRTVAALGAEHHVLGHKVIGISAYPAAVAACFRQREVAFVNVLPEVNAPCPEPSPLEYSIWFKDSYENATGRYKRSFRKAVRQSQRHSVVMQVHRGCDRQIVSRVYPLYERQMRRLNSYQFPPWFFVEFLRMEAAFCLEVVCGPEPAGYVFGVEHGDNLFLSVGGVDAAFFEVRAANAMYDHFIRYACERGLNIHFGLGVTGSGFDRFKQDAGATAFKIERHPDDWRAVGALLKVSEYAWYGALARFLSRRFPRYMAYQVMPTT